MSITADNGWVGSRAAEKKLKPEAGKDVQEREPEPAASGPDAQ